MFPLLPPFLSVDCHPFLKEAQWRCILCSIVDPFTEDRVISAEQSVWGLDPFREGEGYQYIAEVHRWIVFRRHLLGLRRPGHGKQESEEERGRNVFGTPPFFAFAFIFFVLFSVFESTHS
eukprot:Hpha_TRINITY_DN15884_c3_g2::TRINITY_DN15884_c3_g2_i1::g.188473::m.188473